MDVADVYIMMVSSAHQVCKRGKYIAIVSTTVESNDPLNGQLATHSLIRLFVS